MGSVENVERAIERGERGERESKREEKKGKKARAGQRGEKSLLLAIKKKLITRFKNGEMKLYKTELPTL